MEKITYELIEPTEIFKAILIRHNVDGTDTFIPMDELNADYQAYLNTPKDKE